MPFDGIRVLLGCGGVLYSLCTEMPSTAHAPGLLSTPLAREYVCQKCGKALPPLGIEPLSPSSQSQSPKRQNYLDIGDKSQIPEGEENRTSILKIHGFFSGKKLKHQLFLARYETNIDDQTWGAGWPPLGLVPA